MWNLKRQKVCPMSQSTFPYAEGLVLRAWRAFGRVSGNYNQKTD